MSEMARGYKVSVDSWTCKTLATARKVPCDAVEKITRAAGVFCGLGVSLNWIKTNRGSPTALRLPLSCESLKWYEAQS